MITGLLLLSGVVEPSSLRAIERGRWDGLHYYPVTSGGFRGGYFLNDRLPLTDKDIYYHDEADDLIVLFSGYIYNKVELAGLYDISGDEPEPAMAAKLFLNDGPDFVRRLNGDFVIFIGQPEKKQAYLFRDQVGIRPVAYSADNERLIFSSDITGLCRNLSGGDLPDSEYLLGQFKHVDNSLTPSERISRLMPGHYLQYSDRGVRITRYWRPENIRTDHSLKYDKLISDLRTLLTDAVAIRCDNRFNAGAHVSSGLDSGIAAALAREEYKAQKNFFGFSWSPEGFTPEVMKYDERDLVRSLSTKAGIRPLFCNMTADDFLINVADFYINNGHFFEDSIMDQAAAKGVNLIFSGWGGDEFVSTGDRGIETDLLRGLHLGMYFRRNPVRPLKRFVKYFLIYTLLPALGILQPGIKKSFANDARYIKKPYKKSDRKVLKNFYFHTSRRQLHLRYLRFYHLQQRCESWAFAGYLKGIEYRYPLLDKRIIEYMLKVPSELLCRTDHFRPLLRVIEEGILPDDVRLNINKKDPVFSAYWDQLLEKASKTLMAECDQWKADPALRFVDFDLLAEDIAKYKQHQDSIDPKALFRALVYLKAIHQFSVNYREQF